MNNRKFRWPITNTKQSHIKETTKVYRTANDQLQHKKSLILITKLPQFQPLQTKVYAAICNESLRHILNQVNIIIKTNVNYSKS